MKPASRPVTRHANQFRPGRRAEVIARLPLDADLDHDAYDIAEQARAAWEAAVWWGPSGTDPFAAKRLGEVRAI